MKDQYHTFSNENRKAEVFLDTTTDSKGVWLVECVEDEKLAKVFEGSSETWAEAMSDEWVMGQISIL